MKVVTYYKEIMKKNNNEKNDDVSAKAIFNKN